MSSERLGLVSGINLPMDAMGTNINRNTCIVYRSRRLRALVGMEYAAAATEPGTDTASMQAESRPHC